MFLKCPSCRGTIYFDLDDPTSHCPYCGDKFVSDPMISAQIDMERARIEMEKISKEYYEESKNYYKDDEIDIGTIIIGLVVILSMLFVILIFLH